MGRGFSLAEVLVATFLVAVALLALVSVRLYAVQAERGGLERYDLTAAAGTVLAGIQADLQRGPDRFATSYAVTDRPVPELRDVVYSVEESRPEPSLRKFTVTLKQRDRTYQLWTLVSKP